jgi:hypothetical protein
MKTIRMAVCTECGRMENPWRLVSDDCGCPGDGVFRSAELPHSLVLAHRKLEVDKGRLEQAVEHECENAREARALALNLQVIEEDLHKELTDVSANLASCKGALQLAHEQVDELQELLAFARGETPVSKFHPRDQHELDHHARIAAAMGYPAVQGDDNEIPF